jgi:hypothetical protein
MEALSRLVEIIFVDFLIGVQVALLAWFAYRGYGALVSFAYGGCEAKETTNAISGMTDNWPLLLVIFSLVYSVGSSVIRVYDFLGERLWNLSERLWNAIRGGNNRPPPAPAIVGTEKTKDLADGKWSANRFRVLLEEARASDYLGYMQTLTRVTTGVFFNSVIFLILLFLNHNDVSWRVYPFALAFSDPGWLVVRDCKCCVQPADGRGRQVPRN